MRGCLQGAYDSSIVGQRFDSVNVRSQSEARQEAKLDRELARIKKMSMRDIQKAVGFADEVIKTEDLDEDPI